MNDPRSTIEAEARKDPDRLEREIDRQRDHIGGLIGALEDKVSPHEVFDRVVAYGKDNGGEIARNLGTVVKANPVPALLAATGLLWLYASRNEPAPGHHRASRYRTDHHGGDGHQAGEGLKARASKLGEEAAHLRDSASGKWHEATDRMGEGVHNARDSVRHRAEAARGSLEHMLEDNPMAVGAIALAAGAMLGAALPTSEPERRMLSPVGEKLSDKAREAADLARETAREGLETIRDPGDPPLPM